jgi:DNA-binding transcriptional ArsR family regulator
VLRIHFTAADLVRIQVRADPHPLWEVLLSLHLLQTSQGTLMFDEWRRSARGALKPDVHILATLARPRGYSPDFLTPPVDSADLETGLEALLSTERRKLRDDIAQLASETAVPTWVASIADGEASSMRELANNIRRYHNAVLRPHWNAIRSHIRTDRDKRADVVADSGIEGLLNALSPTMRWCAPVLEVTYPVERDLWLEGRGLVLVPSFFCWQNPITLADPDRQPMLVYPVERELGWASPVSARPGSLAALLGRTRATVLTAIADIPGLNTSELAHAVGISLAGASQHATVLRDAGLVITHRRNGAAVHKLSSRGVTLLEASPLAGSGPQ